MADRGRGGSRGGGDRGRGRGASRGGGGAGYQGGRGRGDFRGGRGDGRGDFRGGRGDGRGDFRGGRGDSRGDFRGGRGDARGGRGRGEGRGDFGGGRGGRGGFTRRDPFEGQDEVFRPSSGAGVPAPDRQITELEDKILKQHGGDQLATQMAKLQVSQSSSKQSAASASTWFPCRPAFGTLGKEVTVWANYFKVGVKAQPLMKYTLQAKKLGRDGKVILPDPKAKQGQAQDSNKDRSEVKGRKLQSVVKTALQQVGNAIPYATEYKSQVIALRPFELPENNIVVVQYADEGRNDPYQVEFIPQASIELEEFLKYLNTMRDPTDTVSFPKHADTIDALTVIIGYHARGAANVADIGRSRFFRLDIDSEKRSLGLLDLNDIIRGYFQSARPATGRLLLNVNVTHGVFRPSGVLSDLLRSWDLQSPRGLSETQRRLSKVRAQVKVMGEGGQGHRVFQKTIYGFADKSDKSKDGKHPQVAKLGARPHEVKFWLRDPAPTGLKAETYCSVEEFYKKKYDYATKPDLPVINVGSKANAIYMPAEFVRIMPGQPVRRKLKAEETRVMIEFACRSPVANVSSISSFGRQCLGLDGNEVLNKFGIKIDSNLLTVKARELPTPKIIYLEGNKNKQQVIQTSDGGWNMKASRFLRPGKKIQRWSWIHIDWNGPHAHASHDMVTECVDKWVRFMATMGIAIDAAGKLPSAGTKIRADLPTMDFIKPKIEVIRRENPQFVFVVLPGKKTETEIYNAVKFLGDVEYGFHTVCVCRPTLVKDVGNDFRQAQLFANLGLKVNLKMGGANHTLSNEIPIIKEGRTMVVGYDVTHPTNLSGNAEGLPSLVGLVASIDKELAQWPASAWAQAGRVEMLGDILIERFAGRLEVWRKYNRDLPDNILIFRDGVSEGQFAQVLDQELAHIRKACEKLYPATRRPKITLLVSVKRHQTRFYPTDSGSMTKSRNIKNGTVVDRGVTQATMWDFFLTAHTALQGTARPAHYTVLLDEIFRQKEGREAANTLQKITHEMCYLFGRATKAVSICPPAYYADILCTRQRLYYADLFDQASSDTQSVRSASMQANEVMQRPIHENLRDTMFYI